MRQATIVYLVKDNQVCLGLKNIGHGQGKWNGFGGKVEDSETVEQAAVREVEEEVHVQVKGGDLEKAAELFWYEPGEDWHTHVFVVEKWQGQPSESEEMVRPTWFDFDQIPFQQMWNNDSVWLPKILAGEKFSAKFWLDEEGVILKQKFGELIHSN